jgi:uncharacterized protein (DUF934 family)
MPKLIKLSGNRSGAAEWIDDRFTTVADDEPVPSGDVIISLTRYLAEGEALAAQGRDVGVVLAANDAVETLAYDLPRIPVVALTFGKYRDGRSYTSARLLRERFRFAGEVRAVGEVVLREQAVFMVRCGFDVFAPADGSTPEQWAQAAGRFRHVYQRASDGREPAFEARAHAERAE